MATIRAALTARGYNSETKAWVDVMKGFLYKCGGEVGQFPAGDKVLPWIYIVRDLADSTLAIHSV